MRYRPFGRSGVVVSAVSLSLVDHPKRPRDAAGWARVIHTALETGVNCFEIPDVTPALMQGLAAGFGDLERRLYFICVRTEIALTGEGQARQTDQSMGQRVLLMPGGMAGPAALIATSAGPGPDSWRHCARSARAAQGSRARRQGAHGAGAPAHRATGACTGATA